MSTSWVNTIADMGTTLKSTEKLEQVIKPTESVLSMYKIPNQITLNWTAYPLASSGVLWNMERYTYWNNLASWVISISKIIDGKFRSQNMWDMMNTDNAQKNTQEDTKIVSLDDFIKRDTQEILWFFTFFEQMWTNDEKFMNFWKMIKPYMGEQWMLNVDSNTYEYGYIYPKFANVNCYFYDGNNYYRWEFQINFDGDSLTEMHQDEVTQRMETIKTTLLELEWKFCTSIKI